MADDAQAAQVPSPMDRDIATAATLVHLPRRPDYGSVGNVFDAVANNYNIEVGSISTVFHFHVTFAHATENSKTVPPFLFKRAIVNLQAEDSRSFPSRGSFDGRANFFCSHPIGLDTSQLGGARTFLATPDADHDPNRPKPFKVEFKLVAMIDVSKLVHAIAYNQIAAGAEAMEQFKSMGMALTTLNCMFQMVGSELVRSRGGNVGKHVTFYKPENPIRIQSDVFEIYSGYYQKVKPSLNRLTVNVDVTYGVVIRGGRLLDILLAYLRLRDPRELDPTNLNHGVRRNANRFVRGLQVRVTVGRHTRPRRIDRLTEVDARNFTFEKQDRTISVRDHYKEVYGYTVQFDRIMCAQTRNGSVFPIECLEVVPGQHFRGETPPDVMATMVGMATRGGANQRRSDIEEAARALQYQNSDFLRSSNILVQPQLLQLKGRILPRPQLLLGEDRSGRRMTQIPQETTSWNLPGKVFDHAAPILSWAVMVFPGRGSDPLGIANGFSGELARRLERLGHHGPNKGQIPPPFIVVATQNGNVSEWLNKIRTGMPGPPTLVVAIMPLPSDDNQKTFKHWGDVIMGIPTQVVQWQKVQRPDDQYLHNLTLKINVKIGGLNWRLPNELLPGYNSQTGRAPSSLIIGADVSHPPAGNTTSPSTVGVVMSLDRELARYGADISLQLGGRRVEKITNLENIVAKLVDRRRMLLMKIWGLRLEEGMPEQKRREVLEMLYPGLVFYYRDGVGEQQYNDVTTDELGYIRNAFLKVQKVYGETDAPKPQFTVIIVAKKHHQRFFPDDPRASDRKGNCKAGAVFDQGIAHPTLFDFYLQSQAAIIGTARPAHYIVTYTDNPEFGSNMLQQFSHNLCYVYERATRAVSIPAPIYYADLVCRRTKFYWKPGFDPMDSSTISHATTEDQILSNMNGKFMPINSAHFGKMWFM